MQPGIFKPQYPTKLYVGAVAITALTCYLLWQLVTGADARPEIIFLAVFFGLGVVIVPFALIRRIVFYGDSYTIEKFVWPTKTIRYVDVVDIGETLIRTRSGSLGIQTMTNAGELRAIFADLVEQGKINRLQIENKVLRQEVWLRNAILPAAIISGILWLLTTFIWPYESSIFRDLSLAGFFAASYVVVYQVLKRRADID